MIRNGGGSSPFVYGRSAPAFGAPAPDETFGVAARALRAGENVCVLTGLRISARSGVLTQPTAGGFALSILAAYVPHLTLLTRNVDDLVLRAGHRDVVLLDETLSNDTLHRARSAALACDVFLSVGTSNEVALAATLPWLASAHGATVIVVNASMEGQRKGPSILQLQGSAGATLSRLVSMAFAGRKPRRAED